MCLVNKRQDNQKELKVPKVQVSLCSENFFLGIEWKTGCQQGQLAGVMNTQSVQSLRQLVGEHTKVFFNVQCTGVSEREKKAEKELLGNERA